MLRSSLLLLLLLSLSQKHVSFLTFYLDVFRALTGRAKM
jgi:hypothetical protein